MHGTASLPGLAALLLIGCAGSAGTANAPPAACAPGTRPGTVTSLFLGRSIPDGSLVGDPEIQAFLDGAVTPRFPGFTAADAAGSWRGQSEPTKILIIAHCGEPGVAAGLDAVSAEYRRTFRQEAVGRMDVPACHNLCSGP